MADAITIKALQDASLDAKSLEDVVNGNEAKQVTTRKGETYPSVKKAINTMFANGGLPATPFATKALMTASALVDGKYAQVTNDTANNGLYVKTAGAWVKSAYDPAAQAISYADINKLDYTGLEYRYMAGNLVGDINKKRLLTGIDTTLKIVVSSRMDMASIPVNAGDTLYIKNTSQNYSLSAGFGRGFFSKDLPDITSDDGLLSAELFEVDELSGIEYIRATAPEGAKIFAFNTRFREENITWAIHVGAFSDSYANGDTAVSKIASTEIYVPGKHYAAQSDNDPFKLKGKKIMMFGDSITWGTQGGYAQYFDSELDMVVENYAVSGASVRNMKNTILGRSGNPTLSFADTTVVYIMIGTNNHGNDDTFWSSLANLPTDSVYDHVADSTTDAYFTSFPATFAGEVGASIEYIKWKNPKCRIYLVSPPLRKPNPELVVSYVQYYKRLADMYSIAHIDGTQDSGLSLKEMGIWSYDDLHLSTLGNEVFGKFVTRKVASM